MRRLLLLLALFASPALSEEVDVVGELKIVQSDVSQSALDIRGNGLTKGLRMFIPSSVDPGTYVNDGGGYYSRVWMVLSGTYSGTGDSFQITHPTADPFMLGLWGDIAGPLIQGRAANIAGAYIFSGLDRNANYTFSIEEDGALQWGAASTKAAMDAGLARDSAGMLKVTNAAGGGGSLTVGDILAVTPKATAPATCTAATDIYSDTSGALCFCAATDTWEKMNATGSCA